ncbi:MAG TPA: SDR family NAD(P)-dependent oxidoreductase [Pedobacter sp.]|jgi:short-subunit dehydrogenase involved in D-alanine esterification of teichoic acids
MDLQGNTILITGGSSGIGLALVKAFYALNNKVIIVARDHAKLELIKKQFPQIDVFQCDLTKQSDIDNLVVFIERNHPNLNMLFNNAAIQYNYDFVTEPNIVNKVEYEVSANLTSVIKLCGLLLPTLVGNKNAAVVNISSGLALLPKKSAPVYCATKAAIHNFTKAFRYQMESTNLRVFEILPALIDTPMTDGRGKGKISPEKLVDEFLKDFKNNRFESYIGKTKLLKLISRIWPNFADRILKNG